MGFKIGDKVVLVKSHPDGKESLVEGMTGTVLMDSSNFPAVSFDGWHEGHTASGRAKDNSGWGCPAEYLALVVEAEPEPKKLHLYDKKLLKEGRYEIETVEEALSLAVARANCSNTACGNCVVRMYEKDKGNGCIDILTDAAKFLQKHLGISEKDYATMHDTIIKGQLSETPLPAPKIKAKKKTPKAEPARGTCKSCNNFTLIHGVNGFCEAWHNFTTDGESCSRYLLKTEPEKPVDKSDR